MLKPVLGVAATGVVALLLWKLALPLIAMVLGLALFVIKMAFLVGLICFAVWLVRRLSRPGPRRPHRVDSVGGVAAGSRRRAKVGSPRSSR